MRDRGREGRGTRMKEGGGRRREETKVWKYLRRLRAVFLLIMEGLSELVDVVTLQVFQLSRATQDLLSAREGGSVQVHNDHLIKLK